LTALRHKQLPFAERLLWNVARSDVRFCHLAD